MRMNAHGVLGLQKNFKNRVYKVRAGRATEKSGKRKAEIKPVKFILAVFLAASVGVWRLLAACDDSGFWRSEKFEKCRAKVRRWTEKTDTNCTD